MLIVIISILICNLVSGRNLETATHHHHSHNAGAPEQRKLCVRQKVYRIDDNVVADEERGWLVADDFYKIMKEMDEKVHPFVMVQIDGIPCAGRGCCQGTMMLRPKGSDVDTLVHMIDEYSEFLAILPWAPTTILEGGGNMGVATVLLAHMYPAATIVTLEPHPGNCWLLKANTAPFPNVHVECTGLWDKDANLKMVPSDDNLDWGWRTLEVEQPTADTITALSVPSLMEKYGLDGGFDYAKLDIEGAEWTVFRGNAAMEWLGSLKLLSLEVHHHMATSEQQQHLDSFFEGQGYSKSLHGEYEIWAVPELEPYLHSVQTIKQNKMLGGI